MEKQQIRDRLKARRDREGKTSDKNKASGQFIAGSIYKGSTATLPKATRPIDFVASFSTKRQTRVSAKVLEEIIGRATEVIGTNEEALRWLGTPVRAFDFATPIYMLKTEAGVQQVKNLLVQVEHGVW